MFVNPDKSQAILLDKQKPDYTGTKLTVGSEEIQVVSSVDVLGVKINDKFNFNLHVDRICKPALNKLNALIRLKYFSRSEETKALINSFVLSKFNYCPLVCMLTSAKSFRKIEAIQKRAIHFMINNYESTYEDLLNETWEPNMNLRRARSLFIDICKSLNSLNSEFMKDLYKLRAAKRVQREKYKFNLEIPKSNQVTFGTRSLCTQGPKVWNSLPYQIKVTENLEIFKRVVKFWDEKTCSCNVCSIYD